MKGRPGPAAPAPRRRQTSVSAGGATSATTTSTLNSAPPKGGPTSSHAGPGAGGGGPHSDRQALVLAFLAQIPDAQKVSSASTGEHYTGQLDAANGGRRHGPGVLQWPNGNCYLGQWAAGVMDGHGTFLYAAEGDRYVGQFAADKKHGTGRYSFANGNYYEGGFSEDKRHGRGRYAWTCGDSYDGEWCEGHMHGTGRTAYANGNQYDGMFVRDRREGRGVLLCSDGLRYEGEWLRNMRHGRGVLTSPAGDRYDGEWADDKKHGTGTDCFVNGNSYEGSFVEGAKAGRGVMHYHNGDRYDGAWAGDKMHGTGTYTFANGYLYAGEWSQNKRHGRGAYTYPDGSVYEGAWADDKRHGAGVLRPRGQGHTAADQGSLAKGTVYSGTWVGGRLHGPCVVRLDPSTTAAGAGTEVFKGEYRAGVLVAGSYTLEDGRTFAGTFAWRDPAGAGVDGEAEGLKGAADVLVPALSGDDADLADELTALAAARVQVGVADVPLWDFRAPPADAPAKAVRFIKATRADEGPHQAFINNAHAHMTRIQGMLAAVLADEHEAAGGGGGRQGALWAAQRGRLAAEETCQRTALDRDGSSALLRVLKQCISERTALIAAAKKRSEEQAAAQAKAAAAEAIIEKKRAALAALCEKLGAVKDKIQALEAAAAGGSPVAATEEALAAAEAAQAAERKACEAIEAQRKALRAQAEQAKADHLKAQAAVSKKIVEREKELATARAELAAARREHAVAGAAREAEGVAISEQLEYNALLEAQKKELAAHADALKKACKDAEGRQRERAAAPSTAAVEAEIAAIRANIFEVRQATEAVVTSDAAFQKRRDRELLETQGQLVDLERELAAAAVAGEGLDAGGDALALAPAAVIAGPSLRRASSLLLQRRASSGADDGVFDLKKRITQARITLEQRETESAELARQVEELREARSSGPSAGGSSLSLAEKAGREVVFNQLTRQRAKLAKAVEERDRLAEQLATARQQRQYACEGAQYLGEAAHGILLEITPDDWKLVYLRDQLLLRLGAVASLERECAEVRALEEQVKAATSAVNAAQRM